MVAESAGSAAGVVADVVVEVAVDEVADVAVDTAIYNSTRTRRESAGPRIVDYPESRV